MWVANLPPRPSYPLGKSQLHPLDMKLVVPSAGVDAVHKKRIICPCRESYPCPLVVQPVASSLYWVIDVTQPTFFHSQGLRWISSARDCQRSIFCYVKETKSVYEVLWFGNWDDGQCPKRQSHRYIIIHDYQEPSHCIRKVSTSSLSWGARYTDESFLWLHSDCWKPLENITNTFYRVLSSWPCTSILFFFFQIFICCEIIK
jgi:hypothetical protein